MKRYAKKNEPFIILKFVIQEHQGNPTEMVALFEEPIAVEGILDRIYHHRLPFFIAKMRQDHKTIVQFGGLNFKCGDQGIVGVFLEN